MNVLKTNKKSINQRLNMVAFAVLASVLTTGCNDENPIKKEVSEPVVKVDEKVEVVDIKPETNADLVSKDFAQKINKAKEELQSIETKILDKTINKKPVSSGSKEVVITDIYVVDGDTVYGNDMNGERLKVRMTGIDAPESDQPMGAESTEYLRNCIGANNVLLTIQLDNAVDPNGRTLARVDSGEVDCNLMQIENGMAYFYEDFSDKLAQGDKEAYKSAQEYAQQNKLGVWAHNLQKPWDYRHAKN